MQHGSHHKTLIAILRDAVEAWRKRNGWSRETTAQMIVEAHEQSGGQAVSGIVFEPPSQDTFKRAKANADRIFRWLDDVTKDCNQLPPNFIPSVFAALPSDLLTSAVNDILRPHRLACHALPAETFDPSSTVVMFKSMVTVSASASSAYADLLDGVAPGELERAQTALVEARRQLAEAQRHVEEKLVARGRA